MTYDDLQSHIFVSYSSQDAGLANTVVADLKSRGVEPWIDRSGLSPGTPNWEAAIRNAIRRAFAVVLLASPNSRNSEAVGGELLLARSCGRPVLPALISGEWIDSARLDMASAQFVDLRPEAYAAGLDQLAGAIHAEVGKRLPETTILEDSRGDKERESLHRHNLGRHWSKHLRVSLPEGSLGLLRGDIDGSVDEFLDNVYVAFLQSIVRAYSYGSEWLLTVASPGGRQVVQPLSWLKTRNASQGTPETEWKQLVKLREFIDPDTQPQVGYTSFLSVETRLATFHYVGLVFNAMARGALRWYRDKPEKFLMGVLGGQYAYGYTARKVEVDEVNTVDHPHRYVLMLGPETMHWLRRWDAVPTQGQVFCVEGRF